MFDLHGISKASLLAHSFGTFYVSCLLKLIPERVRCRCCSATGSVFACSVPAPFHACAALCTHVSVLVECAACCSALLVWQMRSILKFKFSKFSKNLSLWCLQVHSMALIDPVCCCMWSGHLISNFVYTPHRSTTGTAADQQIKPVCMCSCPYRQTAASFQWANSSALQPPEEPSPAQAHLR